MSILNRQDARAPSNSNPVLNALFVWRPGVLAVYLFTVGVAACGATPVPAAKEVAGRAVEVQAAAPMPDGHPEVPVGEPASNNDRVGRAARRLNVEQLRASLLAATGFTWVASRRVSDPDSPSGFSQLPDADMLEAFAATLGRPDYVTSTSESIEPAVTFAKLASDAARVACRTAVKADVEGKSPPARILRFASASDTRASNDAAIKKNMSYLALRFWGRQIAADDAQLVPLLTLFEKASSAPAGADRNGTKRAAATPADGWRAVCIAMATDPQFLTY
jgi:hypothetical protein